MKRKGNLYDDIWKFENIKTVFDEVCRNTKNKNKVNKFKEYKCINLFRIYTILKNREYVPGPYHVFTIYEPKKRRIVSQNMIDKLVNHLVSRYILLPIISPCLVETNVASRENKGTDAGLKYYYDYRRICKIKYGRYYILKCDVRKFFASIDHDILKEKLKRKIKDKDALKIVFDIIDSEAEGLGIGNMTSQLLAIFYLNDFDHYVKEDLKIKYYVRYQDDILILHESKQYLKECLIKIEEYLKREKLELNSKTRIYDDSNNFIYLGRDVKGRYAKYRTVNRKIKKSYYLYRSGNIRLNSFVGAIRNFKGQRGRRILSTNLKLTHLMDVPIWTIGFTEGCFFKN